MKTDYLNAKILSHRANLQRYATLLATQLTELEREYLHKRIEEERVEVASLEFARAAESAQAKETVTVPNPLPPHASPLVAPRCGGLVDRTNLLDERAWVVRPAPVLGLAARLEPQWLDVRTGHDEVTLDVA